MKLTQVEIKQPKPEKPVLRFASSAGPWTFTVEFRYVENLIESTGVYHAWGFAYYLGDHDNPSNYLGMAAFDQIEKMPWTPEFMEAAKNLRTLVQEWETVNRETIKKETA